MINWSHNYIDVRKNKKWLFCQIFNFLSFTIGADGCRLVSISFLMFCGWSVLSASGRVGELPVGEKKYWWSVASISPLSVSCQHKSFRLSPYDYPMLIYLFPSNLCIWKFGFVIYLSSLITCLLPLFPIMSVNAIDKRQTGNSSSAYAILFITFFQSTRHNSFRGKCWWQ